MKELNSPLELQPSLIIIVVVVVVVIAMIVVVAVMVILIVLRCRGRTIVDGDNDKNFSSFFASVLPALPFLSLGNASLAHRPVRLGDQVQSTCEK